MYFLFNQALDQRITYFEIPPCMNSKFELAIFLGLLFKIQKDKTDKNCEMLILLLCPHK